MAEHDHASLGDGLYLVRYGHAALELDGVHVRLLIEAHGVAHRVLHAGVIGAEGQVADEVRVRRAAAHALTVGYAHVHSDRHGALPAVYYHAHGVAAEYHIHAGILGIGGKQGVIHYHPDCFFAVFLHLVEVEYCFLLRHSPCLLSQIKFLNVQHRLMLNHAGANVNQIIVIIYRFLTIL